MNKAVKKATAENQLISSVKPNKSRRMTLKTGIKTGGGTGDADLNNLDLEPRQL